MAIADERIDTSVGKVQVLRGGTGPDLVYLHSAMGEGAGLPLLDELASGFSVVAPQFPGFGESEGIEHIDDIEDCVFHILDVLDVLEIDQVVLVGTSLGAWMAAEVASRYPDRVSKLVLVNPAGLYIKGAEIEEIFGRDPADLARLMFADQAHPIAQVLHTMQEMVERKETPPFELIKPQLVSLAATAKIAWDPYLHDPKLPRLLPRVKAATLVVHGAEDQLIPRAHAERYVELIGGARLVDVAGAGHMLPLEKPSELAALVHELVTG